MYEVPLNQKQHTMKKRKNEKYKVNYARTETLSRELEKELEQFQIS